MKYELGIGASEDCVNDFLDRFGAPMPEQLRLFYESFDGLTIASPSFEILAIRELGREDDGLIHFATADKTSQLFLDPRSTNPAGQWNVVGPDRNYVATYSFASFWSNKVWKWIDHRIPFWRSDWLTFSKRS